MKFENVYWSWETMQDDHRTPSILAIGDSWFWYPFPGGSLLNFVGLLVKPRQHWILAHGNNGAEAVQYVEGPYRDAVRASLRDFGAGLSAVFVSGGGNDFAGFNDLRPLLKAHCGAETTAAGCFRTGPAAFTLDRLLGRISESYRMLIGQIYASTPPGIRVFLHNYDYAIPSGKGVFGGAAWLKAALVDAQVPEHLQARCMEHLIDRFTDALDALAQQSSGRVVLVDSRRTLAAADWANELHPTPDGFRKIADQKWRPRLAQHGLA